MNSTSTMAWESMRIGNFLLTKRTGRYDMFWYMIYHWACESGYDVNNDRTEELLDRFYDYGCLTYNVPYEFHEDM